MANETSPNPAAPSAAISREIEEKGILESVVKNQEDRKKVGAAMEILDRGFQEREAVRSASGAKRVGALIADYDRVLSEKVAQILHHEKYQKLEGSWRQLQYLCKNANTGEDIQLKVLEASKEELARDFARAADFDRSTLWQRVYTEEYGMPGGQPLGAMIADYQFTLHPEDMELLRGLSRVAAASLCPVLTSPAPDLFGIDSFEQLKDVKDFGTLFADKKRYVEWNSFRESDESKFVAMSMPRVLARRPFGANTQKVEDFGFEELELGRDGKPKEVDHSKFCWMNAAYALGARLVDAFDQHGFAVAIRGAENGGKVEELPIYQFKTDDGDMDFKCPTETNLSDAHDYALSKQGFIPLCHYKNENYAVFFSGQSANRPKEYGTQGKGKVASDNAQVAARLPYVLAASRISHFLKCAARDWVGSYTDPLELKNRLSEFLSEYKSADPNPDAAIKAKRPLKDFSLEVKETSPGVYEIIALLEPFIMLEKMTTSMRMVAKVPQQG